MRELVVRKDQLVAQRATPPFYLKARGRLHGHKPWHVKEGSTC